MNPAKIVSNGTFKCHKLNCGKILKTKNGLEYHLKAHANNKSFKCRQANCGKLFKSKNGLEYHLKAHANNRSVACNKCDFTCITPSHLKLHFKRSHPDSNPHTCPTCSKGFVTRSQLKRHLCLHSQGTVVKCGDRNKSIKTKESLKVRRTLQAHTPGRKYKCPMCPLKFNKETMWKHMKTHSNERKYICRTCAKTFNKKLDMHRHQLIHSNEKRFVCPTCTRPFARKDNLCRHVVIIHNKDMVEAKRLVSQGETQTVPSSVTATQRPVAAVEPIMEPIAPEVESPIPGPSIREVTMNVDEVVHNQVHLVQRKRIQRKKNTRKFFFACDFCEEKFDKSRDWRAHFDAIHAEANLNEAEQANGGNGEQPDETMGNLEPSEAILEQGLDVNGEDVASLGVNTEFGQPRDANGGNEGVQDVALFNIVANLNEAEQENGGSAEQHHENLDSVAPLGPNMELMQGQDPNSDEQQQNLEQDEMRGNVEDQERLEHSLCNQRLVNEERQEIPNENIANMSPLEANTELEEQSFETLENAVPQEANIDIGQLLETLPINEVPQNIEPEKSVETNEKTQFQQNEENEEQFTLNVFNQRQQPNAEETDESDEEPYRHRPRKVYRKTPDRQIGFYDDTRLQRIEQLNKNVSDDEDDEDTRRYTRAETVPLYGEVEDDSESGSSVFNQVQNSFNNFLTIFMGRYNN